MEIGTGSVAFWLKPHLAHALVGLVLVEAGLSMPAWPLGMAALLLAALITAVFMSTILGSKAQGEVSFGSSFASPAQQMGGLWWFLALVFYSTVVGSAGWLFAIAFFQHPRRFEQCASTGRVHVQAFWEQDLAVLKPMAERLGMLVNRTTTKKEIVRWLIEREYPWIIVCDPDCQAKF